jgi:hypothetical protein
MRQSRRDTSRTNIAVCLAGGLQEIITVQEWLKPFPCFIRIAISDSSASTRAAACAFLASSEKVVIGTKCQRLGWSALRETQMAERDHDPEDGKQIPARPHDTGSQANETVDGLDSETEALRHATEDAPPQPKIEQTPVFDRADLPPKI